MDIEQCLAHIKEGKKALDEKQLNLVCKIIREILAEESNVQPVKAPVNICGDVHGQFFDVLELFNKAGQIPDNNYIFIGDFVDRGYNSVETIELLFCLKVVYPDKITLLRGNHESRQTTQAYGFYDEVLRKYGNPSPWKLICEVFDYLPVGALIEGDILCIHGGLSPDIKTIDQIRLIERKLEIPLSGPFTDLLWSDPDEVGTWQVNSRGAGWLFGDKVVTDFCHRNGLSLIARAHQLVQQGYIFWFTLQNLVTVWSAPNYCYRMGNDASVMIVNENCERSFVHFKEVPESSVQTPPRKAIPYFL